jgi:hypothetical protein
MVITATIRDTLRRYRHLWLLLLPLEIHSEDTGIECTFLIINSRLGHLEDVQHHLSIGYGEMLHCALHYFLLLVNINEFNTDAITQRTHRHYAPQTFPKLATLQYYISF